MAVSSTFTAGSGEGYDRIMGRWSARLAEPFLDFSTRRELRPSTIRVVSDSL
jgi:hypothetical protein